MGLRIRTDEERILQNFEVLKKKAGDKLTCAVVKANAYGHGAVKVGNLLKDKVDYFGVATAKEGVELRKSGIDKPILLLAFRPYESDICVENDITVGVSAASECDSLVNSGKKYSKKAKVHVQVDSGMNRFGVKTVAELTALFSFLDELNVTGVYSHVYSDNSAYYQIGTFALFESMVKVRYGEVVSHISATSSLMKNRVYGDMVRFGLGLYGYPRGELMPVMDATSTVLQIKKLEPFATAGYDGVFSAGNVGTTVAIVDGGYADGISRSMIGVKLLCGGKFFPVVAICMDTVIIEIKDEDVRVGDTVVLIGESEKQFQYADDIAKSCNTIPYEIISGFGNLARS